MLARGILLALILFSSASAQQLALTELALRAEPSGVAIRPLDSIPVQALYYGQDGDQRIRLRLDGATFSLVAENSGWLSKPYRFQGEETEAFYEPPSQGLTSILFGRASAQFVLQDAVVYTAPAEPGEYEIRAALDGLEASLKITVAADAVGLRPDEMISFPLEAPSNYPYRALAEHWAPFIAQETWFQPKADYLARFDFDGDWLGADNWEDAFVGSSQAYVYYEAMETQTHWFLIYNMFHPRDYSDKCVAGSCHENDNEGLILTIRKDGTPFGSLQVMETLAHNNVYSHVADSSVRSGIHNIDGGIELYQESHPVAFIESGGHGVYGSTSSHSRFRLETGKFTGGTGVTYVYKGIAERPVHLDDREVGYELLSIYDHWWLRSQLSTAREDGAFDAYYVYIPARNRPRTQAREIAGSFLGRTESENKAKPFWGWHDNRSRKKNMVGTGQWGLDPAYAVAQNLRIPGPFSLDYIYNPYLGFGTPDRTVTGTPAVPVETAAATTPAAVPAAPSARSVGVRPAASDTSVFDKHIELLRLGGFEF
jgi:hypothetical protein